jgi:hypothetical protein
MKQRVILIEHFLRKTIEEMENDFILISVKEPRFNELFNPEPDDPVIILNNGTPTLSKYVTTYKDGKYHVGKFSDIKPDTQAFAVLIVDYPNDSKNESKVEIEATTSEMKEIRFFDVNFDTLYLGSGENGFLEILVTYLNLPATWISERKEKNDIEYNADNCPASLFEYFINYYEIWNDTEDYHNFCLEN